MKTRPRLLVAAAFAFASSGCDGIARSIAGGSADDAGCTACHGGCVRRARRLRAPRREA